MFASPTGAVGAHLVGSVYSTHIAYLQDEISSFYFLILMTQTTKDIMLL